MFRRVIYFAVATDSIEEYTLIMTNACVSTGSYGLEIQGEKFHI